MVLTNSEISAQRLTQCQRALSFTTGKHMISASLGHTRGAAGSDPDMVLDKADRIMYEAKRLRKERQKVAVGSSPPPPR